MPRGVVLRRVRELRLLELDEVAQDTGISQVRLEDFERGDREPSLLQLEKLAAVYGVPVYDLYGDDIPNLPELIADFRNKDARPAQLTPDGLRKIWAAESRSQFAFQLKQEVDYEPPSWSKDVPSGDLSDDHAEALRDYFDSWLSKRVRAFEFAGAPEQAFLQGFRLFMEVQGLAVSINEARPEDYFGFYVTPHEGLPVAFVNRRISSKKAQLFTLLHETCHHFVQAEGVSDPFVVRNKLEKRCNHFAANFLAPMSEFARIVGRLSARVRADVFALVRAASDASLLSRHATAIRLLEGDFITRAQLSAWEKRQVRGSREEKDDEDSAGGGQVHAKRIGELGYLPTYLASRAVAEKVADSLDVQRGLALSESLQERAFDLAGRRVKAALAS